MRIALGSLVQVAPKVGFCWDVNPQKMASRRIAQRTAAAAQFIYNLHHYGHKINVRFLYFGKTEVTFSRPVGGHVPRKPVDCYMYLEVQMILALLGLAGSSIGYYDDGTYRYPYLDEAKEGEDHELIEDNLRFANQIMASMERHTWVPSRRTGTSLTETFTRHAIDVVLQEARIRLSPDGLSSDVQVQEPDNNIQHEIEAELEELRLKDLADEWARSQPTREKPKTSGRHIAAKHKGTNKGTKVSRVRRN